MASQHNGCDPSNLFVKVMNDVRVGGLSIRNSAKKWGIKRTTLQDHLSGRVEINRRRGPPPILTKQEENQFADRLIVMANRGFGVSKESLLNTVKTFLDKDGRTTPFQDNKPGNKWFRSFVKRSPRVKLRKSQPLEKKRAKISKEDLDAWFNGFEKSLVEKNLADKPSQIWNCNETGFDMQGRAGNVIGPSDRKEAPFCVLPGGREHVTALPCFNACGQWMPPYFLFPGKRIPVPYNPLEGGVEGSVFSMTESGYMWFANHFIPNLPPARPVVLLVDGHDSHRNLELFQLAEKNGNKHDPNACLIWVPELDKIPTNLWNETTDEKRGERVRTIAGLPIGQVPRGLSSCFWDLLSMADVECIEWYVNFQNNLFYVNFNYLWFPIMCTKKYM